MAHVKDASTKTTPTERFDALADLVSHLLKIDEITDNEYGITATEYLASKLGVTHKEIILLLNRRNTDNKFAFNKMPAGVIHSALREFTKYGLPMSMQKFNTEYFTSKEDVDSNGQPTLNGYYSNRRGRTAFSTVNLKKRSTIVCATTKENADAILKLTLACGLDKRYYMLMCQGIFSECVEMSLITDSNPALGMSQMLGRHSIRVPYINLRDSGRVFKCFYDPALRERALYLMNNTPFAYQSDIALRLFEWWVSMQLDGTLDAARYGKVLKSQNKALKALSTLSPVTIRSILMEKKQRAKSELPPIGEIRLRAKQVGYTVERVDDIGGYRLASGGFKVSGMTAREVYIAVSVIEHERKTFNAADALNEAANRAANQKENT